MVTELNKKTFHEALQESTPILVDFWAPWCGPCKMLAPVVEELSKSPDYQNKLRFGKLNTDEYPEIAQNNDIQGIPCLIIFHKGEEVDRIVGFMNKVQLKGKVDEILEKSFK